MTPVVRQGEAQVEVLQRILMLQAVLHVAPNVARLGELSCIVLVRIPGILSAALISSGEVVAAADRGGLCAPASWPLQLDGDQAQLFRVANHAMDYGHLQLKCDDEAELDLYKPYIQNVASLMALIQDNWRHREELERANRTLEMQVEVRTQNLLQSEHRFRTLVEHAPEAIVLFEATTLRFVEVNPNALELFGLDEGDTLNTSLLDVSAPFQADHEESGQLIRMHIQGALEGEAPTLNWTFLTGEKSEVSCEMRLVRLDSFDQQLVRGSIIDVTERRALEAELMQSQKMEAVGQLSGGLAHDFNNLLTSVFGNAELLRESMENMTPEATQSLGEILHAAERGAELAHRLLAFSRRQPLSPTTVQLDELVLGVVGLLKRTLGENIAVSTDSDSDLWFCHADRGQVENSLVNLAINSRDAMAEGGQLVIETRNVKLTGDTNVIGSLPPGDYVSMKVRDTGCGMPPGIVEHIFEPFFTTKEAGKGTGLGLSMVYGFAKQSGGGLMIESQVGQGTSIALLLPRSASSPSSAAQAAPPTPLIMVGDGESILLVEDDPAVADVVSRQLVNLKYKVTIVGFAEEAIQALSERPKFDLMLTDIVLPGALNGHDLAEQVRERMPELAILFMSGYPRGAFSNSDPNSAPAELLTKPFTYEELAKKVRQALST